MIAVRQAALDATNKADHSSPQTAAAAIAAPSAASSAAGAAQRVRLLQRALRV